MEEPNEEEIKEDGVAICEHCGANLLEVGIIETTEGGHGETEIYIQDGYVVFGNTTIENMDSCSAKCRNCGEELEQDVGELIDALVDAGKPVPDVFESINICRELWDAIENGDVPNKFFELRGKIRKLLD